MMERNSQLCWLLANLNVWPWTASAAARAAEVARVGVVNRASLLKSAASKLFLAASIAKVFTRAAGSFPGAAVPSRRGAASAAAVVIPRRSILSRPLPGWDGVPEVVFR